MLLAAAEEGKLDAAGFDLWLRLLDEQAKGHEGMVILDRLLKAKKLDGATELSVRGSVYQRRLANESRFADIKANLKRYIELVDEEEVDRRDLPVRRPDAVNMLARVEEVIAGKPSQLLEDRFDKMPTAYFGRMDGPWKLTQAKGESFLTATPKNDERAEMFPSGVIGYTKDIRVTMRIRLRDQSARIDVYPAYGVDEGIRLAITSTWVRMYRCSPPLQSDLDATLIAEQKADSPLAERWVSVSATIKNGSASFSVNGTIKAESRIQRPSPHGRPAIIVSGGVVDIDDLVVTSL